MIIVTALRTHAAATKTEELVAGRVGMEAAFHFSPEWDGLGKTAVFEAGGVAKDVIVGDDPCIVPHECMIEGAELRVGIYGMNTDGTVVIPTVYALVGTVKKGADPSGDESYPPTPDVGAQAVAAASSAMQAAAAAQEVAAEIQRRADNGEFDGAPGYTPVKGKDYFDGKDGDDYVLTEADKVEIAEIAADLVDVPEGGGSIELDTTLTQSGMAADAKAVGDALAELEGKIPEGGGGGAGIHVGDTAPSDTSVLWVDTSDNEGSTVDSVNGKTGTVVLTAEDVGAMPAGASVDYTLPVATAETLGGVKVGEGLSIDASGVLSANGGGSSVGGGVPTWSLLGEYDMSTFANSANISLTGLDNLTHLYFKWEALQNETSTDSNYWLSINGKQLGQYILSKKSGTSNYGYTICKWNGLVWEIQMSAGAISDTNYTLNTGNALFSYNHVFGVGACTTLSAFIANSTYKPVSGRLKIYGGK